MIHPTDSELEILKVLWKEGECSVRKVNNILSQNKDIGYTTTLKLMQIMHEKGLVDRDTSQRSHIYIALVKESDTKENLLSSFMKTTFEGSASQLIMQALGNNKMSEAELKEIKDLIDKIENK
ncbi:BlaI/MecI/CopY family transcriptional regulator [Portibacter marinus]|uniref:BlaI/MecI/CopY family transcriptional regulator n=1 Tax=Portibacter marinus TaxID=2898660 RepID=UPI001F18D07E|nr:BlaI/MecI/CopY family transcriptional regulator [Portibacter marinus]